MTTSQPTPPQAAPASYWQAPPSAGPDYQILDRLRARLVALVAALIVQATVAALAVLPGLPVVPATRDPDMYYLAYSQPASFWVQFAAIEIITAVVVSFAFGPGVRLGDVPALGRLVLGLGFLVLPAVAVVVGGFDAAQAASRYSPAAGTSSVLTTAIFGTLFFGLPLIALVAPARRATIDPAQR
jgi:hypothetical protein